MTSGKARTKRWVLRFDRRTPPFIEPLMGWTGGDDTLTQVELTFPTRESAVAYAERQGLAYVAPGHDGIGDLSGTPDLERALVNPAAAFRAPNEVVDHPDLTCVCKREILTCWAWDEYLLELATGEAMPEGNEPPRLHEVKCALLALEEAERDCFTVSSQPAGGEERRVT
jgi:hypothetical protein